MAGFDGPSGFNALRPGSVLGPFVLGERLGEGAMGQVFRAVHRGSGHEVALKLLVGAQDAVLIERFRREAEAQARVDAHPNVGRVREVGEDCGVAYLVMDLLLGGDLADRLRAGPFEPEAGARLIRDLALGLAHVHRLGVLHRDLKPQNVLFDGEGRPLLVDFGLARLEGRGTVTEAGAILGTPAYMAPEQAEGSRADVRSDVYGLGAVLYHVLTGQPPFSGHSAINVMHQVLHKAPERPRRLVPTIPPALEEVCLRALAKEPGDRYASAAALAAALDAHLTGTANAGRRGAARLLVPAAAVALLLLVGALFATLATPDPTSSSDPAPTTASKSTDPRPADPTTPGPIATDPLSGGGAPEVGSPPGPRSDGSTYLLREASPEAGDWALGLDLLEDELAAVDAEQRARGRALTSLHANLAGEAARFAAVWGRVARPRELLLGEPQAKVDRGQQLVLYVPYRRGPEDKRYALLVEEATHPAILQNNRHVNQWLSFGEQYKARGFGPAWVAAFEPPFPLHGLWRADAPADAVLAGPMDEANFVNRFRFVSGRLHAACAYETRKGREYVAIWVPETREAAVEHDLERALAAADVERRAASGQRPTFAMSLGAGTATTYTVVWVRDP